ncbi:PREDICTED: SLOW GREEN 1 [Prunus dulcis]|uniref:PREDICTED: SLOW GREEN 1 n=1 Tax=Prunus dulcis TaxID=3755 RepID=A0A5E4FVX1_PRUDU|nr:protein SLOW GREEN 1, chloroplastic [Prunus dulcis]KAI5324252.1 hypothetical protein L3X38_033325 [Prunus dulcis]VVA31562.1 PREDICTED: SLOW GREEN 1 [Prunus dulcis]
MGSLAACSLQPNTELAHTKILPHTLCCKSIKPSFLNSHYIQKPLTLPFKFLSSRSSSNSNLRRLSSHSTSLTLPFCKLSHSYSAFQPNKNLSRFFIEKIVGFVIGSVFFVGCFNVRAAVALPAQTSSSSANFEEKRETQKGKSEDEEMYEKILEEDPTNVGALKVVLYGAMRRGNTKQAVNYVEKLIDVEPDEVEWRLLMALCYEIMGQLSTAKRLFQEILEERPLLLRALHGLALVMHKNHEGPAVFVMLNKALEIAQREKRVIEERNIRILIAQMHVVKGELEEGLNKFQDLVKADPRDFRPYLCQGIIYSLLDQKKEAAEQFETYRALAPEEFPQRGFLDDVVLAAKTKSGKQFQNEFDAEFSNRK